jgi:hypothetical protein
VTSPFGKLDDLCINTLRALSIDTVQHADSNHPGLPIGAATLAYVLWSRHLRLRGGAGGADDGTSNAEADARHDNRRQRLLSSLQAKVDRQSRARRWRRPRVPIPPRGCGRSIR